TPRRWRRAWRRCWTTWSCAGSSGAPVAAKLKSSSRWQRPTGAGRRCCARPSELEPHMNAERNRAELRTHPIADRQSKVRIADLAPPAVALPGFLEQLPRQFAGNDLRALVRGIAAARRAGRPVAVTMGAHVIKCGLSPVLIDLMARGIITSLAMN